MRTDRDGLTRREFLKGSAATVAGISTVGVFTEARGEAIGPNDIINAAIIGTGSQGCVLLGKALKVPNVRFVACCDIQEKNLANGLSVAKGAEAFKDYRQLLDRKDIHAVIIATPLHLHEPMTVEALRAGKHVLCEKMMAYAIDDGRQMLRVARQTGRRLQIGHQRRYSPDYRHAYKMVRDGILGKITHVRAQWNRNGSWRRPCPDPSLDELINWRLYSRRSQGLMAELGSHQIDVVNWMLGETPNAAMGVGGIDYWKDGREVHDNVQCVFEYPSGVKLQYQSLTTNQFDGFAEQFMGDKGTLVISTDRALLFQEPKAEQIVWAEMAHKEKLGGKEGIVLDASKTPRLQHKQTPGEKIDAGPKVKKDDYILELEDFFLSIRDGHEPFCSPRVALDTCVASVKANEAMAKLERVTISPEDYKA